MISVWRAKLNRQKLIAPKGRVSLQMWKTLSRGLDEIELIYKNASGMLDLRHEERYRDDDLYDEIVTWRAALRSSSMLEKSGAEHMIKNIHGESLTMELDDFTIKTLLKMETYWQLAADGHKLQHINKQYSKLPILCNEDDEIQEEWETD